MKAAKPQRRDFIRWSGLGAAAGVGILAGASPARAKASSGRKTIQLTAWPNSNPYLLSETFGPGDARGTDTDRWLTVLRIELKNHLDADGNPAHVENVKSDRFSGEVKMVESIHEASSIEAFTPARWEAVENPDRPWSFQLRDGDNKLNIFTYDSKPLLASGIAGFKWLAEINAENQIALSYSDVVAEARMPSDEAGGQFQLGVVLDPAPSAAAESALSVTAHAASFAAWSPAAAHAEVEISYAGETPNIDWQTPWPKGANLTGNRGGLGLGYALANR